MKMELEEVLPSQIEARSFAIIAEELAERGIVLDPEKDPIIRRCTRMTFIITGAWWLAFTLPLLRTYKQAYGKERPATDTLAKIVGDTFGGIFTTMRRIAADRVIITYMVAFF